MAMEQGGKRVIHPFFCKDFGTSAKPEPEATIATNNDPSHEPSQNAAPVAGHEAAFASWQPPAQGTEPTAVFLEQDMNSERRKRRRTDQDFPIDNGAEPGEEYGVAEGTVSTNEPVFPTNPVGWQLPMVPVDHTVAQLPPMYGLTPAYGGTSVMPPNPITPEKQYPERKKTLKLNPNGKLIQSPLGKQPEAQDTKKQEKGSKRGRKPKKENTKLVVIKYASDDSTRERLGKAIADIISGRMGSKFQPIAPKPNPSPAPVPTPNHQSSKATHPFFLKKPARKSDTPGSIQSVDDMTPNQTTTDVIQPSLTRENSNLSSSGRTAAPFSTFKPRPKFPEPIYPLWPPRDFVHVRSVDTDNGPQQAGSLGSLDRKKAKEAVVRVHDRENVLSSTYEWSVHREIPQALRLPGRYVASGQTLRKAIASQLSNFSTNRPELNAPRRAIHPAITHLDQRLTTSLSAFDTGTCEPCLWTQKYAPDSAEKVLQSGREAHMLRDWLQFLVISAVDTGKTPKESEKAKQKAEEKKRAKKRQKANKLEGFIVSSEDEASEMGELDDSEEDELAGGVTVSSKRTVIRSGDLAASSKPERGRMTNAILLSGPPGSGKTASVYAVAKELDFEVFEINAGSRRSNRDILERVGDMTRNHLVNKMNVGEEGSAQQSRDASEEPGQEDGKQNKLMSFFKQRTTNSPAVPENKPTRKEAEQENEAKTSRPQKQSLILLEEADILFEEDRQFWTGVMTLIQHSRRPIIITCNDESLIPLENISFHAILRYRTLPHDLAVDYLLLVAANEGHILQRTVVSDLYNAAGNDLRKTLMDLNFWCQMAIGSQKSGLDWMLDRWPIGIDLDQNGDPLRVLSLNTYQHYMGWFSRDMLLDNTMDSEVEAQKESLEWWQLSIQDSETMNFSHSLSVRSSLPVQSKHEQLEQLRYESEYAEMRSALDVLCNGCPVDPRLDSVDPSVPPMPEKHRMNYIEGHRLLHADLKPEYSSMATAIGSTTEVLMGKVFRSNPSANAECSRALQVLANNPDPRPVGAFDTQLTSAFEPMIRADELSSSTAGRLAPSFNNGTGPLWEDLAPYIRAIVAFDLRLEQYRLKMSGLLSPNGGTKRKMRKTRASRAALEGGDKAHTRRERWFPPDTNPARILATGNHGWQDLLVQNGHFGVGAMPELEECSREELSREEGGASEASSEGGI